MGLTSTTTLDIPDASQTITFFNPSQVDQIVYSGNTITFQNISTYNLVKSDYLLYVKYLTVFYNLLITNFPNILNSYNLPWPLSVFDISITSVGVTKIVYNQTSLGVQVINVNYVPIATSAAIAARTSPVTITLQEFFMTIIMMQQHALQVGFN